jgi:MFS family permease
LRKASITQHLSTLTARGRRGPAARALRRQDAGKRDALGRPTARLSAYDLFAVSAYWLAITSLMGALSVIIIPRFVEVVVGPSSEPLAAPAGALLTIPGVVIAILVQPTIGAISDNTRTRLGRRKPYILAGTLLDMAFLSFAAWAFLAESYWAFMAAVMLPQLSSNFAQGPYQGYVPDLVPTSQVGIASGLLGAAQMAGQLGGPALATVFLVILDQPLGIFVTLGVIELATMLITVLHVPDRPGPPTSRSLRERGLAAWGTDILAERNFLWLLVSRLFVLIGLTTLLPFGVFYLQNAVGMARDDAATAVNPLLGILLLVALLTAVPGGRISGRIGRKPVIYTAVLAGAISAALMALVPSYPLLLVAIVPLGLCLGVFLSVDWALMTDIIPKAESGRYMGISNVVTAGSGLIANASGALLAAGVILLTADANLGYRSIMVLMVLEFALGAWALTHVREPARS